MSGFCLSDNRLRDLNNDPILDPLYISHKDALNRDILNTGPFAQLVVWFIKFMPAFGNLRGC